MFAQQHRAAEELQRFLYRIHGEVKNEKSKGPFLYEDDIRVHVVSDGPCRSLETFWNISGPIFIMEREPIKLEENDVMDESQMNGFEGSLQESVQPLALPFMRARQLLSLYTAAHNPNMSQRTNGNPLVVLPPLWVRCDGSDGEGTCWLGAEPIKTPNNKISGMSFRMVTCNGPTSDKTSFPSLETLLRAHRGRHRSPVIKTKGFAQYDLFGSTMVENTFIESQSSICVDFAWNGVDNTLQIPPLTSAATLNIRVESGDVRSPLYSVYKELEFLLVLAEGLKTGVTDWPEPTEARTVAELVQELLNEEKNKQDGLNNSVLKTEAQEVQSDTVVVDSSIQSFLTERGDLDFAEMLWCKMRSSVSSYEDVVNFFSLVIQSLKHGQVKPWIHGGSSSSLSKLIQQSYHGNMQSVSLSGLTPIRMLLEIGLDKMKKDYTNCFIARELVTLKYLDDFISTSADLQEQVHCVKKLHHMLEVVASCNAFLNLGQDYLFPLTQSCLKYYQENKWNEQHVFRFPIRPSVISNIYQNLQPQTWRGEIISGRGQTEVRTSWQLSSKPPVDHVSFDIPDLPMDMTLSGENEEILYYPLQVTCSQVHFS